MLPWRRLRSLIEHLPDDSALARAELGRRAAWGVTEQLLVEVIHRADLAMWQKADPKKRGPAPAAIPTPWDEPTRAERAEQDRRLLDLERRNRERLESLTS